MFDNAKNPSLQKRDSSQGFTLIEMLIAIALLAVVSLLSWRGLDAIARSRTQIDIRATQNDHLRRLISQFDSDCSQLSAQRELRFAPIQLLDNGFLLVRDIAVPTATGQANSASNRQDANLNVQRWQAVWYRKVPSENTVNTNSTDNTTGGIERLASPPLADRTSLNEGIKLLLATPLSADNSNAVTSPNFVQRNLLIQGDANLESSVWLEGNTTWINQASSLQAVLPPFTAAASTVSTLNPLPVLVTGLSMSIVQQDSTFKKLCLVNNQ